MQRRCTQMMRKVLVLAVVVLVGLAVFAQEFPKAEVGLTYSYVRYTPAPSYAPSMNGNGGGGSVTFNVSRYFGVEAELMGMGLSKAHWTVPVGNQYAPNGASITSSGNLFTYLFGPKIRIPAPKVDPYFDFLFGGVHTSSFHDALAVCANCTTTTNPSGNAFGMSIGGGLDVPVSHMVAIRVGQIDYLYTRFHNGLTGEHGQNNFRYQAGVVFRFGSH